MTDKPRLIEVAFPIKQASIDSVHEKNVRHGHISTLHIWPARRPLAACRAALIATLLPDPGNEEDRQKLLHMIAGRIVRKDDGDTIKEETAGGILHWGRESDPSMDTLRAMIREAYGGRAPKVLDPFSGGGAIPLEAMRLGCEVTAIDINPVAWFLLKCTLDYPQRLAGKTWPLPSWSAPSDEKPKRKKPSEAAQPTLGFDLAATQGDLAAHVRAWGTWVFDRARVDLDRFYPVLDGKPTVAYLWARTVTCKGCRTKLPLLKTRWLCKKKGKQILLKMDVEKGDVPDIIFAVVPADSIPKDDGKGTMSRTGATCPACKIMMTMEDIRLEGQAGRLGQTMTAVVVDGKKGKEYRLPTDDERDLAASAANEVEKVFVDVPFGLPVEPTPAGGGRGAGRAFSVQGYGIMRWCDLFTPRQLVSLGTFVKATSTAREAMKESGYATEWVEAISALTALAVDRVANRASTMCIWNQSTSLTEQTFARFALPILWDYSESNPLSESSGNYLGEIAWVSSVVDHICAFPTNTPKPMVLNGSAKRFENNLLDVIVTDPPYYDAIPYSDLMDFFYIWLRRSVVGLSPDVDGVFRDNALSPKWNHETNDGELIDDSSRHEGNDEVSKQTYEDGMAEAFRRCWESLNPSGRLVIVFAHKHPDAWATLASAIIRAGFIVDGSWPIQTERTGRMRANASAALSSSVWLVCKKRPVAARPGWDNQVLQDMRANIYQRLADFWQAGIRGPDFVWAATGPALEAYSKHPVVKKANAPGEVMAVAEFLREVRRIVVDFVVGQVLHANGNGRSIVGLDDLTTYYLLHRHDFGLDEAPIGPCILYAVSCGLSDTALVDRNELLIRAGSKSRIKADLDDDEKEEGEEAEVVSSGGGSKVKLKPWNLRKRKGLGDTADGKPAARIDQIHRLMHLWKAGDVAKVEGYLEDHGLRRETVFQQLIQALIELSTPATEERSLLESLSNHLQARGDDSAQENLFAKGMFPGGE